jgi:hypothetical protein
MYAYRPSTEKEQRIINNINKSYDNKESLFEKILKRLDITAEDLALMFISSTVFALIIVFLV